MIQDSKQFLTNSRKSKILDEIINQFENCEEFIISVAFITFSGVVCILEVLRQLRAKGIKGKILTGCYLNFTEPKALKKLLEFDNIELKILNDENFHAKGFFFRNKDSWQIILGSSNLTQSALTINNEWNLLIKTSLADVTTQQILAEFDYLFDRAKYPSDILDEYIQIYQRASKLANTSIQRISHKIQPNKIQCEALESLRQLRDSGKNKALIISATGTGKTFLSAFDIASIKPKRCLFVVHRTNIAIKAQETFAKVISDKTLGLYTGGNKTSAEYLFATVQTLKNSKVLANFKSQEFEYIIIDEVHHAEAESYKKVLAHFTPKFLLGMTATPERSDVADIFKLFDYNIAYEIRLHQALEQDLLCPFHYFAVEDLYLESEEILAKNFAKLVSDVRVEHIIEKINFYGYSGQSRAALMFVSNVDEAKELATKLSNKGIKAKALSSQDSEQIRQTTIAQLESGELEIIVTVDIFNEGVDIPCINQIILLRPTQSAIVYIQQLGRGLRKYQDKKFVVILDFIANYTNNFLIAVALSGDNSYDKDELKKFVVSPNNYLAGKSTITFSSIAKEIIYKNIQKTNFSQLKNIKRDYTQLKKELGRIPSLVDFQHYNFISPEVILSTKDTYYDVLKAFKEDIINLDIRQYNILKFLSKEFTPAKRLYEILILEELFKSNSISISELETSLKASLVDFEKTSFTNALLHLSLQIFTINAGRQDYEPLISVNAQEVSLLVADLINKNSFLYKQIIDLIAYNKLIYARKYSQNKSHGLAMYAKYTKKEIAHLLNQDYTNGGVNLAGYRAFGSKALLFMTFDEYKKFGLYDNKFISQQAFSYYSRAAKTLDDPLEKALAENSYQSYVFARINKHDSYFFLGLVSKCLEAKEINASKKLVSYIFELEKPIPKEIWQYFTTIYKNKI
ncbi:DEAD/DEAH box helicase [Francisella tularensis]|uniref:DEAD/DEAH box helicase n=1 Tax=Francisella tularensis TaxID=263 RepID=UPI001C0F35A7|nr:DEAD/DEAH box helicase [Francisella tularensis]MBK2113613.1 DEAD/DEAH box helicase [Francisella tularensis subsp. tularensis]